jgi:hypothetical protein
MLSSSAGLSLEYDPMLAIPDYIQRLLQKVSRMSSQRAALDLCVSHGISPVPPTEGEETHKSDFKGIDKVWEAHGR